MLLIGSVAGAGEYDYIFDNPNLSSEEKLEQFTIACGWTSELETWLEDYHRRQMEQNIENLNSAPSGSQSGIGMGGASADPAQEQAIIDARMQAQYDAYQAEFAANYRATARFSGQGSGTEADPYIITNREQFLAISSDLMAYYKLSNNIDMGGKALALTTPITDTSAPFTGNLDGDGYVIENLHLSLDTSTGYVFAVSCTIENLGIICTSDTYYIGFFQGTAEFSNPFTIKNCWIDGTIINSQSTSTPIIGLIASSLQSTSLCTNSWVTGSITINDGYVTGGVIGANHANYQAARNRLNHVYSYNIEINQGAGIAAGILGAVWDGSQSDLVTIGGSINAPTAGRVYGDKASWAHGPTHTNLYATSNTLVNGVTVSSSSTTSKNGADVSNSNILSQSWWQNTAGFDFANTWYWSESQNRPIQQVFYDYFDAPKLTGITISATPVELASGQSINLSATVEGTADTVQWQMYNGSTWSNITTGQTVSYTIPQNTPTGMYKFRAIASNDSVSVISNEVEVFILSTQYVIDYAVNPTTALAGDNLSLTVNNAISNLEYIWQYNDGSNWVNAGTGTSVDFILPSSLATGTYPFRCTTTVGSTTITSDSTNVSVVAQSYTPTVTATPAIVQTGNAVTLTVTNAIDALTYQWQYEKNGTWTTIEQTGSSVTYTVPASVFTDTGDYNFRAVTTVNTHTLNSNSATVQIVTSSYTPTVTVSPTLISTGEVLSLDVTNPISILTYKWEYSYNNGAWTQFSTGDSVDYTVVESTFANSGTYAIRCSASNGGVSSITNVVIVTSSQTIETTVTPSIAMVGDTLNLTVTNPINGVTYKWQYNNGGTWIDATTGATASYVIPSSITANGLYNFRAIIQLNNGIASSDSTEVLIVTSTYTPTITVDPTIVLVGNSVDLTVTNPIEGLTYQWQYQKDGTWNTITQTGTSVSYTLPTDVFITTGDYAFRALTEINSHAVNSSATTVQVITSSYNPTVTVSPTLVSTGDILSLNVTNPISILTYDWEYSYNGGTWTKFASGDSVDYTVVETAFANSGKYTIRSSSSNGGTSNSTEITVVTSSHQIDATVTPNVVMVGDNLSLTVTNPIDGVSYKWQYSNNGTTWTDATTGATATYTAPNVATGTYQFRAIIELSSGTATSQSIQVLIVAKEYTPTIDVNSDLALVGQTITLTVNNPIDDLTYQWQYEKGGQWVTIQQTGTTINYTLPSDVFVDTGDYNFRAVTTVNTHTVNSSPVSVEIITSSYIPEVTVSPDVLMNGDTLSLSVTNAKDVLTYDWQYNNNGTWTSFTTGDNVSHVAAFPTSGQYDIRCQASNNSVSEITTITAVATNYTISTFVSPRTLLVGDTIGLGVNNPIAGLTYQWQYYNGSIWVDAVTGVDTSFVIPTSIADTGVYPFRCTTTVGTHLITSTSTDITIIGSNDKPVVNTNTTIAEVDVTQITFSIQSPVDGLEYRWQYQLGNTWYDINSTGSSITYTPPSSVFIDTASYKFRSITTVNDHEITSDAVEIEIITAKYIPEITVTPDVLTSGDSLRLTVTNPVSILTYTWELSQNGGVWSSFATGSDVTYTMSEVNFPVSGEYDIRCVASSDGVSTSESITFVTSNYDVKVTIEPTLLMVGDTLHLVVNNPIDTLTYQWQYNTGTTSSPNWVNAITGTDVQFVIPSTITESKAYPFRCTVVAGNSTFGSYPYTNVIIVTNTYDPVVTATPNIVEVGDSITLAVTSPLDGVEYTWQYEKNGTWNTIDQTGSSITYTVPESVFTDTGDYNFRSVITVNGHVIESNSVAVQIITSTYSPTITVSPDILVTGDTMNLDVTNDISILTYQWQYLAQNGNWVTFGTGNSLDYVVSTQHFANTGLYSIRCVASNGGISDTQQVTILTTTYDIQTTVTPTTLLVGDNISLKVNNPLDTLTYQWQYNNGSTWVDAVTGTDISYTIPALITQSGEYEFRCVVKVGTTSVASNATTVTILTTTYAPVITVNPTLVLVGDTINLSVNSPFDGVEYGWQYEKDGNWTTINQTGNSIVYTTLNSIFTDTNTYNFRSIVNVNSHTITSNSIGVEIVTATYKPEVTVVPDLLMTGDVLNLTVENPIDILAYEWQYSTNGQSWSTFATGDSVNYTVSENTFTTTGNYMIRCVASNTGTSDISTISIVTSTYKIGTSITPTTVMVGDTLTLTIENPLDELTYQWQYKNGNTWVNATTGVNATFAVPSSITQNGIYEFRATSTVNGNEIVSDSEMITIITASYSPTITVSPDLISVGDSIDLSVTSPIEGITYGWQYEKNGTWTTIQQTGSSITYATLNSIFIDTGTYNFRSIVDINGHNVVSNSVGVEIITSTYKPEITVSPDLVMTNDTLELVVTNPIEILSYEWQQSSNNGQSWSTFASGDTTTYAVSETTFNTTGNYLIRCIASNTGVSTSEMITVVTSSYNINTTITPTAVLVGDSVSLKVDNPIEGLEYKWQYNNGSTWVDATTGVNASYTIPNSITQNKPYEFRVTVNVNGNTITSTSTNVTIITSTYTPVVNVNPTLVLVGNNIELFVTSPVEGITYGWQYQIGDTWSNINQTGDSITYAISESVFNETGIYNFRATVNVNNHIINSTNVPVEIVTSTYQPTVTVSPDLLMTGNTLNLEVTNPISILTYQWQYLDRNGDWKSFGATGTDVQYVVSQTDFPTTGVYTIRCMASNGNASDTVQITIVTSDYTVTTTVNPTSIVVGDQISLSVNQPIEGVEYQWQYKSGETWINATTGSDVTYTIPSSISQSATYPFRCVATIGDTTITSSETDVIIVTANYKPSIDVDPTLILVGDSIDLSVVSPVDGIVYEWQYQKNGTWTTIGQTGASITYTTPTSVFTEAGVYDFRTTITVNGHTFVSDGTSVEIITSSYQPEITVSPEILMTNDSLSLEVTNPISILTYQWQYLASNGNWVNFATGDDLSYVVAENVFSTSEIYDIRCIASNNGVSDVVQVTIVTSNYEIDTNIVPTTLMVGDTIELSVNEPISTLTYEWQYQRDGNWITVVSGANASYVIPSEINVTGDYPFRAISSFNGHTIASEAVNVTVVTTTYIPEITVNKDMITVGEVLQFNVISPVSTLTYKWQYELNGEWITIEQEGATISYQTSEDIFVETGTYRFRTVVTVNNHDVASESVSVQIITSTYHPTGTATPNTLPVGQTVTLTVTDPLPMFSYSWQYSNNNQWIDIGSGTTVNFQIPSSITITGTYPFRAIGSANGNTYEGTPIGVNIISTYSDPIISQSGITSSNVSPFEIPIRVLYPYQIVDVYTIDSQFGLVVTSSALYVVDVTSTSTVPEDVIKATKTYNDRIITHCVYSNGNLLYSTTDNEVYMLPVYTGSFGNERELTGFTGTVSGVDISLATSKALVECVGTGAFVYSYNTYAINLERTINDTESDRFILSQENTDGSLQYVVFASNDRRLRAYMGTDIQVDTMLNNSITDLYAVSDATSLIVTTTGRTAVIGYTLNVNAFNYSSTVYTEDSRPLHNIDAMLSGARWTGINANSLIINSLSGDSIGYYPTSGTLSSSSIADITGLYAIVGSTSGQVSIIQSQGTAWTGAQSFSINGDVKHSAMSGEGFIAMSATNNYVYHAIQTGGQEDDDNIITTKYYLKISVYDANHQLLPNSQVTVISPSVANTYTTDNFGTVTVEVVPTYTYTIQLPNGANSITYTADNYALQYISISYPYYDWEEGISYSAGLQNNRYIGMNFNDENGRNFDVKFEVYDNQNNLLQTYHETTSNFSESFDTRPTNLKNYIVKMEVTYDGNVIKNSWVISVTQYVDQDNQSGGILLGDIPIVPPEMDKNWVQFLFCGLIMIIGGMFGYAHSVKGCLVMVFVASLLTIMGILHINIVWMVCMVILAILCVYSYASQNEAT